MSSSPVRVALMDDYEIVVVGLARMLAPFSDRIEVVELDARVDPIADFDLLLFDTFGRGSGATDLAPLVRRSPGKVVIYSWADQDALIDAALAEGVAGYLPKSMAAGELVESLEKIHAGATLAVGATDPTAEPASSPEWPGREHGLSARESEVLGLITQGLSNKQVAAYAYIGDNTVKTHVRNIYRKIGVTRRAEAVRWGMQHGFEPDRIRILPESPTDSHATSR